MTINPNCVCGGSIDDPNPDCERCDLVAEIGRLTFENERLRVYEPVGMRLAADEATEWCMVARVVLDELKAIKAAIIPEFLAWVRDGHTEVECEVEFCEAKALTIRGSGARRHLVAIDTFLAAIKTTETRR